MSRNEIYLVVIAWLCCLAISANAHESDTIEPCNVLFIAVDLG